MLGLLFFTLCRIENIMVNIEFDKDVEKQRGCRVSPSSKYPMSLRFILFLLTFAGKLC